MPKEQLQPELTLYPINILEGKVNLPGSKSISNRVLLLAALANGTTRITNLLDCDDVRHMLVGLKKLNINYTLSENNTVCEIQGNNGKFNWQDKLEIFLGNSGTSMRFLTAALCLNDSVSNNNASLILTGDPRMQERPIEPLVTALTQAGAKIDYLNQTGFPPLALHNQGLIGGNILLDGSLSSQFLTALLMALPLTNQDSTITIKGELVSKPYIDITLKMLKTFGVTVKHSDYQIFYIQGKQKYIAPTTYHVEGDASSASYFLAAAAIKGKVTVNGIGLKSIQGDIAFAHVLEKMGAKIIWQDNSITVEKSQLHGIDIDLNHIPDAAMTLAIVALFAKGPTTIRNIYTWRLKETDRLQAMENELRKVGAIVETGIDYITIQPPQEFKQAKIETYNDHRMAMCFSLIALSDQSVTILDPKCTNKTFPDFFNTFAKLYTNNHS